MEEEEEERIGCGGFYIACPRDRVREHRIR